MLILVNRFGSRTPSTWIGGERTIATGLVYRIGFGRAKNLIFCTLTRPRLRLPAWWSLCRYNRYVIRLTFIAAAAISLVLLAGCKKDIQDQEAVRQGVMSYLAKRSDLLAMDVSVTSVAFRQDEATAQVHFQAKGNSSAAAGMTMQYVLERKGGQWSVKGRAGAGAAHGSSASPTSGGNIVPGQMDGMPRIPAPGGAGSASLPPGHPAVSPDAANQQK